MFIALSVGSLSTPSTCQLSGGWMDMWTDLHGREMLFDLICVGKWAKLVFMPMQTNFFPKRSLAAGRSFCRRDLLPTSQCLVLGWRSSWGYTAQHDAIGARWGCGLIIFPRQRKDHLDPFGWLITVVSATKIHKHTHTQVSLSACQFLL